jgi:U3 small nucleolar RNA-associated protein 12
MGLTKQYRRFLPSATFGIVGSIRGGICTKTNVDNQVYVARGEDVLLWDLKRGELLKEYKGEDKEVTAIDVSGEVMAVGYHDGAIRLFDTETAGSEVTLAGHKSAVTTLTFDATGHRLASGSLDTMTIVWDVINECGLYKLRGHKAPVTRCRFLPGGRNVLVTSSRDSLIKFWDLDIQHCFSTLAGHVSEVWDFELIKDGRYIISGSGDSELRVWKLTFEEDGVGSEAKVPEPSMKKLKVEDGEDNKDEATNGSDESNLKIERLGAILRAGQDKVSHLSIDKSGRLLVCHGSDNTAELFLICSPEEVKKRCLKRARKERRKGQQDGEASAAENFDVPEPTIQEEFRRLKALRADGKVRSIAVGVPANSGTGVISLLNANNMIEQFTIDLEDRDAECQRMRRFDHPGHRSDVRTVSFSSDNTAILSGSHESVKVWNRGAQVCIRTIFTGYCLCSFFVPGDRQAVVGTKQGKVQIIDVASAEVTEEVDAHEKEIWGMSLAPDGKGFVTASADQTVKFWDFELIDGQRLSVVHKRTLKLEEDALAVKLSADGRLIAVSLLDSTVKVFFVDSLKFFLSLYGHKLPALAMDISSDSALMATGSADKNVKIWGLDFGDCHKSIFAHDDNVTALQFVPGTHLFFTAGKDGKVKQWDADNFERILTLNGHHGEVMHFF